ncbi:MAG: YchJ family protein [Labedaea sp.]
MSSRSQASPHLRCPCGSGLPYDECCARAHAGTTPPGTAEALMRSRYSAFALGECVYLLRSWHPRTRPDTLTLDPGLRWEHLEIVATHDGGPVHTKGTVEFRAHYRTADGSRGVLHENSRFVRDGGRWVYLDGDQI